MSSGGEHWSKAIATKADVGFVAADTVIAIKSIQLAMLALKSGDMTAFEDHFAEIEKLSDQLWGRFQALTGDDQ